MVERCAQRSVTVDNYSPQTRTNVRMMRRHVTPQAWAARYGRHPHRREVRHIHLIAQHVPHHTGLHPGSQGLHHRHVVQRGQSLIDGKTAPVPTPEHLFQQFPEFAFSHDRQCTHIPTPYPPQPGDPRTPPLTPASAAAPNHRKRRGGRPPDRPPRRHRNDIPKPLSFSPPTSPGNRPPAAASARA